MLLSTKALALLTNDTLFQCIIFHLRNLQWLKAENTKNTEIMRKEITEENSTILLKKKPSRSQNICSQYFFCPFSPTSKSMTIMTTGSIDCSCFFNYPNLLQSKYADTYQLCSGRPPIQGCTHIFHLCIGHAQHSENDRNVLHMLVLPSLLHIGIFPLSTPHGSHTPRYRVLWKFKEGMLGHLVKTNNHSFLKLS